MAQPTVKTATNGKSLAWSVREEDLEDLESLRGDLLEKARTAQQDGRLFVSGFYTQLAATVAPEIKRIRDRFDRENLASIRKELKDLKAEARSQEEQENIAPKNQKRAARSGRSTPPHPIPTPTSEP